MDFISVIFFLPFVASLVSTVKITLAFKNESLSKDPLFVVLSLKGSRKQFYAWRKEGVSVSDMFSMVEIDIKSEDLGNISYVSVLAKDDSSLGAPVSKDDLIYERDSRFLLVM